MDLLKLFRRILRDRRGSTAMVMGLVMTLILVGILIPIGLQVTGSVKTVVDALDLGTAGNTTRTTLYNNIYSAYDLSAIIPILAGASAVVGAITLWLAFRQRD